MMPSMGMANMEIVEDTVAVEVMVGVVGMEDTEDTEGVVGMEDTEGVVDVVDVEVTEEGAPMVAVVQIIMEEVAEGAALTLVRRWMLKLKPILATNIVAFACIYK